MPFVKKTWADGSVGATPITAAELNRIEGGIVTAMVGQLNVKDYGAVGDGVTDDSAAFAAAATAAKASLRTLPFSLQTDKAGGVLVEVPPGDYLITNPGAFLGDEVMTQKGVGLHWRGAGKWISNIIFKPASAGSMMSNDYWLGLQFTGLGFYAATAGCTFMQSYTTHNAQAYTFTDCGWVFFKYVIDLQGDNNNSEFIFVGCYSTQLENAGAFLFIGTTNTVDQFLNYWFYGHKHWSTQAPLIDAAKGGHFHLYGVDVSDWGVGLASAKYVINLRGTTHAFGVCTLSAVGLRVEAKSANAGLIYSEWQQGTVSMSAVDWSSQAGSFTYGDIISVYYNNTDGAIYSFSDSTLAGGVKVRFSINDWAHGHRIAFTNCDWLQKTSPSDVVTYDTTTAASNDKTLPPVRFVGCRGGSPDVFSAGGAAVWDATIGYRGQVLQSLEPRSVSVRGVYGVPTTGDGPIKVRLPVGATITALQVLCPSGANSEADGGTWTLATTDGSPVTVAAVTVSGAISAGFDVTTSVSPPFECSTTAKATLTVTATNVGQNNPKALLLIRGYW